MCWDSIDSFILLLHLIADPPTRMPKNEKCRRLRTRQSPWRSHGSLAKRHWGWTEKGAAWRKGYPSDSRIESMVHWSSWSHQEGAEWNARLYRNLVEHGADACYSVWISAISRWVHVRYAHWQVPYPCYFLHLAYWIIGRCRALAHCNWRLARTHAWSCLDIGGCSILRELKVLSW